MSTPLDTKVKEAFRAYLAQRTDAALTAAFVKNIGTFTAALTGVLTFAAAHGRAAGDKLRFITTTTLPAGLSLNTTYFVIASGLTTTALKVSLTLGGSSVTITTTGTGTHTASLRAAYTCYRGVRTGLQLLPAICVGLLVREPGLETDDSPLWNVAPQIVVETAALFEVNTGSSADSEDSHDAAVAAVEGALNPAGQSGGIRAFANSENVSTRPAVLAEGFHLAEFPQPRPIARHYDHERKSFVTVLTWPRVQVMNSDADA